MKSLPKWLTPHLFIGRNFDDLTNAEIEKLKFDLKHFQSDQPDISIVIPAWNEENNIYRTLSSLSANKTNAKVEIIVINNNSTDRTQQILDLIGVKSYFESEQGISFARSLGLKMAKGKYHLAADSDTFYPPSWIDAMVQPMINNSEIVGVYGRYSFIPTPGSSRSLFWIYEKLTGVIIRLRKKKEEHVNFLGFNMGFVTKVGIENGGFKVKEVRKFDNAHDSDYFVEESEDGRMAVNLMKTGRLQLVTNHKARVFTSSRRLAAEGGIYKSFKRRAQLHLKHFGI
jgi:glycosyltransferase involved in cell wall biosynthesis